jgi:hypothetical protein
MHVDANAMLFVASFLTYRMKPGCGEERPLRVGGARVLRRPHLPRRRRVAFTDEAGVVKTRADGGKILAMVFHSPRVAFDITGTFSNLLCSTFFQSQPHKVRSRNKVYMIDDAICIFWEVMDT